jgi:SAM-dependent methyltransferase
MLTKSLLELPQGERIAEASPARTTPFDLDGFSSLPLLGTAPAGSLALYLLSLTEALLTTTDVERPRVLRTRVTGWTALPVRDAAVDVVIVDLDAAPARSALRRALLAETRRVLRPNGHIIAVLSHARIPRNRRNIRGYRVLSPLASWVRLIRAARLIQAGTALLQFNGERLSEITWRLEPPQGKIAPKHGDAIALVLSRRAAPEAPSVLTMLLQAVEAETAAHICLERCLVRKIGKTALFLRTDSDRSLLIRVARSPIALERARRNFDALAAVRREGWMSDRDQELIPYPVVAGRSGSYPFFVETVVKGRPRQPHVLSGVAWEPDALRFISSVHAATAVRTDVTVDLFQRLFATPIETISRWCDADGRATLAMLARVMGDRVIGSQLPLVRSHGDFTADNCLYEGAQLSGVVDWELSSAQALPLLDLLQLMEIAGESNSYPRWQRADILLDAAAGRGPLADAAEINEYVAAMGIDRTLIPSLLLMHWVDHVSNRIEPRSSDAGWVDRRVRQPLERIRDIVASSRS